MYSECAGEADAFRINTSGTDFATPSPADIGSNCTEDFVVIDGKCLYIHSLYIKIVHRHTHSDSSDC